MEWVVEAGWWVGTIGRRGVVQMIAWDSKEYVHSGWKYSQMKKWWDFHLKVQVSTTETMEKMREDGGEFGGGQEQYFRLEWDSVGMEESKR